MQISLRVSHDAHVEHVWRRQRRVPKVELVCDGRAAMVARLRVGAADRQAQQVVVGVRWAKLTSNSLQKVIVVNWSQSCALIFNIRESISAESTAKHVIWFDLGQGRRRAHAFLVVPITHALPAEASEVALACGVDPMHVTQTRRRETTVQLATNFDVCLRFLI